MVITVNIYVNTMARQLERNTGKYPAGGSQTARRRCQRSQVIRILCMASVKLFLSYLQTVVMFTIKIWLFSSGKCKSLRESREEGEQKRTITHK
jgi:hypothetical protein